MKKFLISFYPLFFILCLSVFSSCSYFSLLSKDKFDSGILRKSKQEYTLKDKSGEFLLFREKGFLKDKKQFVVKRQIFNRGSKLLDKNILEQSITISTKALLDNKITVLRPKISEYTVWFNKQKFRSHMELNEEKKHLVISLKSSDPEFSGEKVYPFPENKSGVFCFFSQLIECSGVTKFLELAIKKGRGEMNFYIIWEGFPYLGEQYENIPKSPFAKAKLRFDGQNRLGEKRFSLNIIEQIILYFVDEKMQLKKMFWPAQSLSLLPNSELIEKEVL